MSLDFEDSIVAVATPPGEGGVAIVRLSGEGCKDILARVVRRRFREPEAPWQSHHLYLAEVHDGESIIDEVLAVFMAGPHSYTGQDSAEIHCHGGRVLPSLIVDLCLAQGARLARPGEYTLRAYLSGKLDLAQAESVLGLIEAGSRSAVRLAARGLEGALTRRVAAVRDRLLDLVAELEAELDFGDEVPSMTSAALCQSAAEVGQRVTAILKDANEGQELIDGVHVVLVGPPNVGKSTLYNVLVGAERALVSPYAGTTRDQLESVISLLGVSVRLCDTAGLRVSEDPVEQMGVARSQSSGRVADILVLVLDGSQAFPSDFFAEYAPLLREGKARDVLVVLNKDDLGRSGMSEAEVSAKLGELQTGEGSAACRVVRCSLVEGSGVEALVSQLGELVAAGRSTESGGALSVNQRQREALLRCQAALESFAAGAQADMPHDCLLLDLHLAIEHLGAVYGQDVSEDILDRVFSKFCLGK